MTKPPYINLILEWYEKIGDALVGEEVIAHIPAKNVHKILEIKDEKEYFAPYCYELNKERAAFFQPYVKHIIDLDKYDYSVSGITDKDFIDSLKT